MKIKKICTFSILLAIGVVIQIFENSLPVISGIPGGKLGLANIVTILLIHYTDSKTSLIYCTLRPIISSLLYGGITQMIYSLSGSVISWLAMLILIKKSSKISYIGVGVTGAAIHNLTQVTVSALMYSNPYIYTYLSPLLILSVISGYFTGFCSTIIIEKTKGKNLNI